MQYRDIIIALVLVTLVGVASSSQYVPIPKKHPGVLVGSAAAQVLVELIYDPQCNNSHQLGDGSANLNSIIQQVVKQLGNLTDTKIAFRYYLLALPYHIYSTKLTQGYEYIRQIKGDQLAYKFINYCMDHVTTWGELYIANTTIEGFESQLAADVADLLQVDKSGFSLSLRHGTKFDLLAREEFKHITGTKGVSGTPRAFINGALADGSEDWTVDQWVSKLNSLL